VRIITIELINQMNQPEGQTPEFDAKWEAVLKDLDLHNQQLVENCHYSIKNFIEKISLFECPVHSRSVNFVTDEYPLVIGFPEEYTFSFHYEILGEVKILHHRGAGFDPDQKASWLYDEFHKIDNHYEHHIVFSDGLEMQIPFVFFFVRKQFWFEE